jgi:hypothetical protein
MKTLLRRVLVGWLASAVVLCALAAEPATKPAAPAPLSADAFTEHVKYLASDALAGRRVGSTGIEQAAEYIARQFEAAELKPAGEDGGWFQRFEATWGKKLVDDHALLTVEGGSETWQVRKDWIPLPFSAPQDVDGPLAFAGYGIEAPQHGYDDYADFDAKEKVLLVFRYEPMSDDPGAEFGGQTPSRYSLFGHKAKTAAQHGARALLIVNRTQRADGGDALYPFDVEQTLQTFELPLVQVSRPLADALLQKGGLPNLTALEDKLNRERKTLSADLKLTVHLKTGIEPNVVTTRNVLGRLAGHGDTPETVVVGGHYDHIGCSARYSPAGQMTLVVHNGADDNASGTAGVIELARALTAENGLRRNVLFITFSGEEAGMVGSNYFIAHPTVELGQVRAMVNIDMIGRLHQGHLMVVGTHTGAEFPDLVRRAAETLGLQYGAPPTVSADSDHAAFYGHKVPVLFPTTWVHAQYHQPSDDWELLDAQGAARVLTMCERIVRDLACMTDGPTYQAPPPPPESAEAQPKPGVATPEHEGGAPEAPAEAAPLVRLEIFADAGPAGQPGVVVQAVIAGGAAQRAGLQEGDRIVRIADAKVEDLRDYLAEMRKRKPGDVVDVTVMREGKEVSLKATLVAAPRRPATNE